MCNSFKVSSWNDPRFCSLPSPPVITAASSSPNNRFSQIFDTTCSPFQRVTRRAASFRPPEAVLKDAYVSASTVYGAATLYELLGVPESGSLLEIKQAYKQLARKFHPDVSPPGRTEEYTQRFIRVQEAYETLSDPGRRAMYDRDMIRGLHHAFSAGRRSRYRNEDEEIMEERREWKRQWEVQLSELKRRSMNTERIWNNVDDDDDNNNNNNMSWAARMRKRRAAVANA